MAIVAERLFLQADDVIVLDAEDEDAAQCVPLIAPYALYLQGACYEAILEIEGVKKQV